MTSTGRTTLFAFTVTFFAADVGLASFPGRVPWCTRSKGSKVVQKEVRRDRQGKKIAVGRCLDGRLHGLLTHWYPNGVKRSEARYRHGQLDGVSRSFTIAGKVRVEAHYRAGKLYGKWTQWHERGAKKEMEGAYGAQGQVGCWRTWSIAGAPLTRQCYRQGKRHGESKSWHANGVLAARTHFVAGKEHGPCERYFESGRLREKGAHSRGKRHGWWTFWHENGQKAAEGRFLGDQEHGEWKSWNAAGIATGVTRYVRGRAVVSRRFFVAPLLAAYGLSVDPARHQQLLLVEGTTPKWTVTYGHLRRFAWQPSSRRWKQVGGAVSVRFGKGGLGRGRGLAAPREGPIKGEGDGRSPAGVFLLGTAFGTKRLTRAQRGPWPWRRVDALDHWVDDPTSSFYNTWQRLARRGEKASWRSAERLDAYRLAIVVKHNMQPVKPNAGSAIFLHTGGTHEPSVGCTMMSERELQVMLRWLRPSAKPVLVQLPSWSRTR